MTAKSSVSLTDQQHAFAWGLVEEGRYPSLSAVLQQGVELLRERVEREAVDTAALRALLARRREGPFVSGAEMDARLDARIAAKRRAHGLEG